MRFRIDTEDDVMNYDNMTTPELDCFVMATGDATAALALARRADDLDRYCGEIESERDETETEFKHLAVRHDDVLADLERIAEQAKAALTLLDGALNSDDPELRRELHRDAVAVVEAIRDLAGERAS